MDTCALVCMLVLKMIINKTTKSVYYKDRLFATLLFLLLRDNLFA
jgi:hypothetical protein